MLFKCVSCLCCLTVLTQVKVDTEVARFDQRWIEALFLMASVYYLLTSSLYIFSYPLSEHVNGLPKKLAFALMRILTAFLLVACIHLFFGVKLEFFQ